MWYTVWTKFITRITIWVLLLLGWVSRAVSTANMTALLTSLVAGYEQSRTFVTGSSHTLTRLLVNQVLASRLARPSENNLLFVKGVRVIRDDRGVLLIGFDNGGTSLATGNDFGFASLGRVTCALGAASMLAAGALLGRRKGSVALVAGSSYTHANRLVNAENSVVGGSSMKFGNIDVKSVTLAKFLSTLLYQLAPRHLGDTLQAFIFGLSFHFLNLGNRGLARLGSLINLGGSSRLGGGES